MTTTTDATEPGLRERKRVATHRAIQLAALRLVAERGLEGVTIDEVSRIADISPRTFFNYFGSKEEAVLGDPPEIPAGEVVDRFMRGDDGQSLIDGLATVLIVAGDAAMEDAEMMHLRHTLVKQHPQLFAMRMAKMRKFEDQIASIVAARLKHDEPDATPSDLDNRSRLITLVVFGVLRHAWSSWATADPPIDLAEQMLTSFGQLKAIFP